jgi:bifunctional UDP-N-acetylglucosamine pyrophosphorylase/glucosamine-1-phosphate N-acetyltransferase
MTKIIILAAGKGKRMGADMPKVLVPLKGKPIIKYLMEAVFNSGVDKKPVVVVSPDNREIVKKELVDYNLEYAVQGEQLGTAHAVLSARRYAETAEKVIVINGDHPFIKAETIKKLAEAEGVTITMLTTGIEDFNDWRKNFYQWGRIIRENGEIREIMEFKDADEKIRNEAGEVNPAIYAFDGKWLWENIEKINNNNALKEYQLTDLIKLAFQQKEIIASISIDPKEAMGINSKEELEVAEKLCAR